MTEPTKEQSKEFWEWCGCKRNEIDVWTWICPDGTRYTRIGSMPNTDLDFLFKYAVPKLIAFLATQPIGCPSIIKIYGWIFNRWEEKLKTEPDPALALFWAIYSIITSGLPRNKCLK